MTVAIELLTKPNPGTITSFVDKDEIQLYDAYVGNMEAASALASKKLYHDAWLTLSLAVECFLKYGFCLVREKLLTGATGSPPFDPGLIGYYLPAGFLFIHPETIRRSKNICAKDLSHDLPALWNFYSKYTNVGDKVQFPDFHSLMNELPAQKEWISRRYEARNHGNYRQKYLNYRRIFQRVLRNSFRSFA